MTHAVIGAGAIGRALVPHLVRSGLEVVVANQQGPASLARWVAELGRRVTGVAVADALRADTVVLAVPFGAVPDVASRAGAWDGRIVIDATNAIDFPGFTPTDLGGRASSEVVADAVPGARVVKAFNTVPAALLAQAPTVHGGRRVIFLSGNHPDANAAVGRLIDQLGFAPVDLGRFAEGGRLQQFGGVLVGKIFVLHPPPAER